MKPFQPQLGGWVMGIMTLLATALHASPPAPVSAIQGIQMAHDHLQHHHIGAARWVLEKAQRHAPRSVMLRQCITPVIQAIPSPPTRTPWWDRLLATFTQLTLIEWATLTCVGISMMSVQWVLYRWRRRPPTLLTGGVVVLWMGLCAMGWGVYAWEWRYPWAIQGHDQALAITPNGAGNGITVLAGEKVRQRGHQKQWVDIERANGQRGWVPASTCWRY